MPLGPFKKPEIPKVPELPKENKKPEVKAEKPKEPSDYEKMMNIFKAHGSMESNIPINSDYWKYRNKLMRG